MLIKCLETSMLKRGARMIFGKIMPKPRPVSLRKQEPNGRGAREIQIGVSVYRIHSDDNYLGNMENPFEPDTCQLINSLLPENGIAFDIGANIGCTSLLMSERAKAVHAFEPSPSTFKFLVDNTKSQENIVCYNVGLGDEPGEFHLTHHPNNRAGAFISDITSAGGDHVVETVKIVRGDSCEAAAHSPSFIKIDAEGFELSVIRGLKDLMDSEPVVLAEMNHWCLNAFRRISIPEFLDFFIDRFPIVYAVEGNGYLDVRKPESRYRVMYQQILKRQYSNIIAGFHGRQFDRFHGEFTEQL